MLVLLFYRKIALTNLVLVDYDLLTYFYPYKEAAASALREGRFPLWNPYLFTGAPFMANPQTALFYPLNLPGYAFSATLAVKYSIIIHVFLAGVFTYAFGRASLGLARTGAMASALCFMFGGFLTQQVGHINQLNAAVWLPLILMLFDLGWRKQQPLFALAGGLALSAQVLAGHSQETFLLLVAFGLYAAFRLAESAARRPSPDFRAVIWKAAGFAAIVGLGIGLSATQLIPTLELSQESIRGGGLPYKEAASFSLPPWLLARSLLPSFTDSPFSEYIAYTGIIPLFLAAIGLMGRRARPRRAASVATPKPTPEVRPASQAVSKPSSQPSPRGRRRHPLSPLGEGQGEGTRGMAGVGSSLTQDRGGFRKSPRSTEYFPAGLLGGVKVRLRRLVWRRGPPLDPGMGPMPPGGGLRHLHKDFERRWASFFWLGLGLLALFMALGGYNPLFEIIYRIAPPLGLFRVPARWLYLYAFAVAALAGIGADRLVSADVVRGWLRGLGRALVWAAAALIPVAVVQLVAARTKEDVSAPVFWAWVGLIVIAAATAQFLPRLTNKTVRSAVLVTLLGGELFVAGSFLNSDTVTAPQAVSELRPTALQLLQDPGLFRILSVSRTDFDPGDASDLKSIFSRSLDQDEIYQLLVAIKHQEALSPNIPMKYGIATLDGYDGGVLPLRRYVDFKALLLDGSPLREATTLKPNQADALLRDQLAGAPDTRLLGLLNVKYIVADKQGDLWLDNVYYDLSTPVEISAPAPSVTLRPPDFEATSIGLVLQFPDTERPAGPLAQVTIADRAGRSYRGTIDPAGARDLPQPGAFYVKLDFDAPHSPLDINVSYLGAGGRLVLRGASLIDGRTGASESLGTDPHLRLVHSGDLKIYENLDWQPRAFIAQDYAWIKDDRQALDAIRNNLKTAGAPPAGPLVLDGVPPPGLPAEALSAGAGGQASILSYQPERVLVQANLASPGYLVLADSYYPGWRAFVDGREQPVLRAEYLFRAVYLPAGAHQVEFRYEPGSFRWGMAISVSTLALMALGGAGWTVRRRIGVFLRPEGRRLS
ncbi:MAG: YfhO family protein [Dehalococcoidia bacterium]|nr:YfhO family protein [Dehalococcoidia bacterium]